MAWLRGLIVALACVSFFGVSSAISVTEGVLPEHVIVLMMENRSFDHLLGWLHEDNSEIEGLDGSQWNAVNVSDPNSLRVYVDKKGYDVSPSDPNHDIDSTTEQIYGWAKPYGQPAVPNMSGFVQNTAQSNLNISNPMSMFSKALDSAPVINTLAQEFVVFDHWYASVPGPTDPNRGYVMSGTSNGMDTNYNGTLWSQQSYFDFLTQHGVSWRAYFQIDPWAIMYYEDMRKPENIQNVRLIDRYFLDLKNENLPSFAFLQPQMDTYRHPPDWQHPDASVREGERLIKAVYEALRNSTYWEKSALLITYDEHGGFFDHVKPPEIGIPPPDNVVAPDGFKFDRLGIRVPTVLVSPLVARGIVEHDAVGPMPTSHYEHCSVMATSNKIFGISDTLTKRSEWAGTFEKLFNLTTARQDAPLQLPALADWTVDELHEQWEKPLNDHFSIQVEFYCRENDLGPDCGKDITNQLQASLFVREQVPLFLTKHGSDEGKRIADL